MHSKPRTFLGFDYGTKRIGVAIGQNLTKTARPLITLSTSDALAQIKKLITKWRPEGLVVGVPLNMDGTSQPLTQKAMDFADSLKQFSLPIYEMDERLTTKAARESIFAAGGYQALQDGQVDSVAAQFILENWLQSQDS